MKIVIDARLYGLENAGLGRYSINLIKEIAKIDKKNKYLILLRRKYFNSLKLPKNWTKILADIPHYSVSEQTQIPKIINEIKPDLVHFLHFNVPLNIKSKYIVTIHDLLMHKNKGLSATTLIPPLYFIKRLGYKAIFSKAVRSSRKIIVPSNAVKKEVVDYYKIDLDKIEVIYEGFDNKISYKGDFPEKSKYFVYSGNAYPHKNLERLIKAVSDINKEGVEVSLLIASSRNVFTRKLEDIINKNEAQKFVKLLGFVPDKDLGSLYKNSVAFVFPSISEGFGLPGLEALSSGTLLVASDIPVFREIYAKNAIYFDPFEISAIKNAMHQALELSEIERSQRINVGRNFAKRYSWAKMARETLKIYEEFGKSKKGSDSIRSGK